MSQTNIVDTHRSIVLEKTPNIWGGRMNLLSFFFVHAACFAAIWTGISWKAVTLAFLSYMIRMFGITAGYHRYFSHKTYKLNRVMQFIIGFIGCASAQKGPLWWAAHHRAHHQNADSPFDIHSPVRDGFFWSHMGWILSNKYDDTDYKRIPDLTRFPELMWLNRHFLVPPVIWGAICLAIDGLSGLVWGFFISTTILWHSTFLINSASHLIGSRRYETDDTSRNNWFLAIITLGEGWHNNHHYYPASVNQGFYWWEIDMTYYALRVLNFFGLAKELRKPPERVLELGRAK